MYYNLDQTRKFFGPEVRSLSKAFCLSERVTWSFCRSLSAISRRKPFIHLDHYDHEVLPLRSDVVLPLADATKDPRVAFRFKLVFSCEAEATRGESTRVRRSTYLGAPLHKLGICKSDAEDWSFFLNNLLVDIPCNSSLHCDSLMSKVDTYGNYFSAEFEYEVRCARAGSAGCLLRPHSTSLNCLTIDEEQKLDSKARCRLAFPTGDYKSSVPIAMERETLMKFLEHEHSSSNSPGPVLPEEEEEGELTEEYVDANNKSQL